jgi:hypothetical protein
VADEASLPVGGTTLRTPRGVPAGRASVSGTLPPYLQVVRGDATLEEIAALVATLSAVAATQAGPGTAEGHQKASGWADRSRLLRVPVHPSPGGWRRSARP